ncbi:MAG: hypothetical protein LBU82_05510 [Treponema sp.]|jgi:hypothetical protein|nr:hypothetical protein [Treponema sp.]
MKIKRSIFWLIMPVIALALSVAIIGCASSAKKSEPEKPAVSNTSVPVVSVPDIDYSKIGPDDSVILAYIDPQLVKTVSTSEVVKGDEYLSFILVVGKFASPVMQNIKWSASLIQKPQSCQMRIPNGAHTISVSATRGAGNALEKLPFEAVFDNVAITYKIRLATNEEKKAGGLGLGNEVYTMEEVSQKKLR